MIRQSDQKKTDLSSFQNSTFDRGASRFKELTWMVLSAIFFNHSLAILNPLKIQILRWFGAKVGIGVLIKPNVKIKFPWRLVIGDHVWIGENVWIDNLAKVSIGDHVCLSQGAMLLTGNHNYKKSSFDLMLGKIVLEEGAWIGAQSVVCPGVTCSSHSVLSVGAIANKNLEAYYIYKGNPAEKVKLRIIE